MSFRVLILVALLAPWPTDSTPYTSLTSFRDTTRRLGQMAVNVSSGEFRVGVARVDLTPPSPVPLAGFIGQIVQPYEGVDSTCFGKALTIANGDASVTIVAADLLLIDERMVRSILSRTGLARDQIYFTATHTHSGPGGWGIHPLERLVSGTFDPLVFDHLCARLSEAIRASRARLEPAEVAFVQTEVGGIQRNRIAPGEPTNDLLSAWFFRSKDPTSKRRGLGTLVTFGAHATISHPTPPRLGGDYPAALTTKLESQADVGVVLFAAGTVGDASPVRPNAPTQRQSIELYGNFLRDSLIKHLGIAAFRPIGDFANLGLEVSLPPVQVPCFAPGLRFNPSFFWWIGRRTTYLHALKIGPAYLIGFPGDYSGHLGTRLIGNAPVVATSFNGDYRGYLTSQTTFQTHPCYETRWMSFFGSELGDSLGDLARRCVTRIAAQPHRQSLVSDANRF